MKSNLSRSLESTWTWIWAKDKERVHWRRYVLGAIFSTACIVALASLYMLALPVTYTSEWSVILPGAGSDTRLSLDRIGQAQSSASSPFSDKSLSPKVNYKEIAESRPVITEAAAKLGLNAENFGKPRIKLVDQASVILFEVKGPSAAEAQKRSWVLFDAFRQRLDHLRANEVESKNDALRSSIKDVDAGLKNARQKLLNLQTDSGLASMEQYSQLVSSIETLRRDQANTRATVAEKRSELETIQSALGLTPSAAARLLQLAADPEIRQLSASGAAASAAFAEISKRYGAQHPRLIDGLSKLKSIRASLDRKLSASHAVDVVHTDAEWPLPFDNERTMTLFASLVEKSAEFSGHQARLSEIDKVMDDLESRRTKLGVVAARLDDLQRDHMIANAVFSSALARLDASKSDFYASYPLAQMLSEPTLPEKPSSPRLLYALIAAVGGSILASFGWFFAWLHQWFLFETMKKRRSLQGSSKPQPMPA